VERNRRNGRIALTCFVALLQWSCGGAVSEDLVGQEGRGNGNGTVLRLEAEFDEILPADYRIERIAGGFVFAEGPLWVRRGQWQALPFLAFSDIRNNALYRWNPQDGDTAEILRPVFIGAAGSDWSAGPAGLALDAAGNFLICEQGDRRIGLLTPAGRRSVFVDRFNGKRFNSPNDLVWGPDGWLYFTDPPFGLKEQDDDPEKELDFNGVFRVSADGQDLELLAAGQSRPNGLAFSPDGQYLYVSNSDPYSKNWIRYPVAEDRSLGAGRLFYDVTSNNEEGLPDGLVTDRDGRVYAAGPGGVWVFSPDGVHLGSIQPDEPPANIAWGNEGRTLYMAARTGVYRIQLNVQGTIN
jgi:gluconolactonase